MNVSNYKDNNFQEMLESFKHLNEKFHGEMRSGFGADLADCQNLHCHLAREKVENTMVNLPCMFLQKKSNHGFFVAAIRCCTNYNIRVMYHDKTL